MSARAKFIEHANRKQVAAKAWDAMMMASTHDPDLLKAIRNLDSQVDRLFRKLSKLERK